MVKQSIKIYAFSSPVLQLLLPIIALAQGQEGINRLVRPGSGLLIQTLNLVIGILFVLATLIFLWGVIQFIAKSGDEQARTKAKGIMTWGIVGLAIMAAAWGIVNILTTYFVERGVGSQQTIPGAPGTGGF